MKRRTRGKRRFNPPKKTLPLSWNPCRLPLQMNATLQLILGWKKIPPRMEFLLTDPANVENNLFKLTGQLFQLLIFGQSVFY